MKACCECNIVQTANDKCHLCESKPSKYGPLGNAYTFRSLHYTLAYYSFIVLESALESGSESAEELAKEFGVTVDDLHRALEELYTDNADPDNLDTE